MAVKLIIDSASDITSQEAKELGIIHLPMKILFGDVEYEDTINLSHHDFYEKLIESDVIPTTCQIPPSEFSDAYRKVVDEGDTAVVIVLSSKLSGTYQSAMIAAQDFEDKVIVVDSQTVCIGERILAYRAMDYIKQGLSAKEVAMKLEEDKLKIRVMALLDTLEYLKKGGRISKAVAMAGGLLSIKPVIAIENGEVAILGKARGSRQGNNLLREMMLKCGGLDTDKPYCTAYSGLSDSLLKKYIEDNKDILGDDPGDILITTIGCSIGTHAGPGAVAVAFFEK